MLADLDANSDALQQQDEEGSSELTDGDDDPLGGQTFDMSGGDSDDSPPDDSDESELSDAEDADADPSGKPSSSSWL